MKEDPQQTDYLGSLLTDTSRIGRAAVTRHKPYEEISISAEAVPEYEKLGWQFDRRLIRVTKVKREKPIDERLESRFWMLLVKMGYPEVSDGRNFTVLIERKGAEPLRKQIDVFAKDEETVIVAECKASAKPTRRSLQKDIEEFANLKGPMAAAIQKHYGSDFKPKIIWLFVTENVIWSDPDKQRVLGENIRIITERELRYYSDVASHLGRAARYQFLAEFLKDQQIPELAGKTVPAIKGSWAGSLLLLRHYPTNPLQDILVNHRSLNDPEGAPSYQRLVSKSRIRDIGEFIKKGGYFPNNILINFIGK